MKRYIRSASTAPVVQITREMQKAAYDPNTSSDYLAELADIAIETNDFSLGSEVSANPNTPVDALVSLSHVADFASHVAENPNIPAYLMNNLSRNDSKWVRTAVVHNKNVTPNILRRLTSDSSEMVRMAVANNPKTPVECLRTLATDYDYMVRDYVASNPSADDEALAALTPKVWDSQTLGNIIDHPNVSEQTLSQIITPDRMTNSGYSKVYPKLIRNPRTPYETLAALIDNEDAHYSLAKESTNPQILDELSSVCKPYIRKYIAENPSTGVETLAKLAKSRDREVRQAVANNPNATDEILSKIRL